MLACVAADAFSGLCLCDNAKDTGIRDDAKADSADSQETRGRQGVCGCAAEDVGTNSCTALSPVASKVGDGRPDASSRSESMVVDAVAGAEGVRCANVSVLRLALSAVAAVCARMEDWSGDFRRPKAAVSGAREKILAFLEKRRRRKAKRVGPLALRFRFHTSIAQKLILIAKPSVDSRKTTSRSKCNGADRTSSALNNAQSTLIDSLK